MRAYAVVAMLGVLLGLVTTACSDDELERHRRADRAEREAFTRAAKLGLRNPSCVSGPDSISVCIDDDHMVICEAVGRHCFKLAHPEGAGITDTEWKP